MWLKVEVDEFTGMFTAYSVTDGPHGISRTDLGRFHSKEDAELFVIAKEAEIARVKNRSALHEAYLAEVKKRYAGHRLVIRHVRSTGMWEVQTMAQEFVADFPSQEEAMRFSEHDSMKVVEPAIRAMAFSQEVQPENGPVVVSASDVIANTPPCGKSATMTIIDEYAYDLPEPDAIVEAK